MKQYNEIYIEYKYITNVIEILTRFNLNAQEKAGNNNSQWENGVNKFLSQTTETNNRLTRKWNAFLVKVSNQNRNSKTILQTI